MQKLVALVSVMRACPKALPLPPPLVRPPPPATRTSMNMPMPGTTKDMMW